MNALGYLFIRLHSQGIFIERDLLGSVAFSLWAAGLSLRVSAAIHRRLAHDQLFRLCGAEPYALFFPDYYEAAFKWAQPVLFGELAIMLWLLIKGAKVPAAPGTLQPATGGLAFR